MDRFTRGRYRLTIMVALGFLFAGRAYADSVTVHAAPNGQYFVKQMCDDAGCEAIGYRATMAESNLELWRASTFQPGRLTLSDDGDLLVSEASGELTIYLSGQVVGTANSRSAIVRVQRQAKGITLVASDGTVQRFVPDQSKPYLLAESAQPERGTSAPREARLIAAEPGQVDSIQADPIQTKDGPANPESATPVPAVVSTDAVRAKEVSPPKQGPAPKTAVIQTIVELATPETAYECEVVVVMRSGRRVSVVQQGPSQGIATDRAMAVCEGMIGAGSRSPAGTCEPQTCQALDL